MIMFCEFCGPTFYIITGGFLLEAKALSSTRGAGGLFYCHTNNNERRIIIVS